VARKGREFDFEAALKELECLVDEMEKGEMRLEEALRSFERGIELTRGCQKALGEAEQKVQILIEKEGGEPDILPFGGG
jgi:exodeoxyribonuclease VII small subunit